MKNFRFEMTKVYSGIPPPHEKLQIWDDQSLLQNTPPMKNFRFEMTKVNWNPPPPPMKNFRFEMTKFYSRIPPSPKMKNFRFEMTKVYSGIPPSPKMKNFRFEMTKVYSGIPPQNEKLQIWDDQSLLQNTPPPIGLQSWRWYVETNLHPPWIPLVSLLHIFAFHTLYRIFQSWLMVFSFLFVGKYWHGGAMIYMKQISLLVFVLLFKNLQQSCNNWHFAK